MRRKVSIVLGLCMFFSFNYLAQDSTLVRDLETWSSFTLSKKAFDKKVEFSISPQVRLEDNSSKVSQFFIDFGADAKVFKNFSVGANFRYIKSDSRQDIIGNTLDELEPEKRFSFDVKYKHKLDRFKLSYRLRYQNRNFIGYTSDDGDVSVIKYRLKAKVDYNIRDWKLDPYFASEIFYTKDQYTMNYIPEITETTDISAWQKLRFTLGTSYKFNKHFKVSGYYRLERQFANYPFAYNAKTWNIFGINLKVSL